MRGLAGLEWEAGDIFFQGLFFILPPKVKYIHFMQFEMNLLAQDEIDLLYK